MLKESFISACLTSEVTNSSASKNDCIQEHEYQPQSVVRKGFKNSSSARNSVGVGRCHVFAAQAGKSTVHVYNRQSGKQEATVPFQQKLCSLVVTSGGFPVVILGTESGSLILWEVTTSAAHLHAVTCLALSPDNLFLVSASPDSACHLWSLERTLSFFSTSADGSELPAPLSTFTGHRTEITSLVIPNSSPSDITVLSSSKDGTINKWEAITGHVISTTISPKSVACLALDPAARALYIGHGDGSISSQDLMVPNGASSNSASLTDLDITKDNWASSEALDNCINAMGLTYDGTVLITGHENGRISSWSVTKRRLIKDIARHNHPVTNILMLLPSGLRESSSNGGDSIVKPQIELSQTSMLGGGYGIPANYTLNAKISQVPKTTSWPTYWSAAVEDGWPEDFISEGARQISTQP
ncbi:MAG: hypothetical protein Q9227_004087 [Pyrenula ochraceoflavens]